MIILVDESMQIKIRKSFNCPPTAATNSNRSGRVCDVSTMSTSARASVPGLGAVGRPFLRPPPEAQVDMSALWGPSPTVVKISLDLVHSMP